MGFPKSSAHSFASAAERGQWALESAWALYLVSTLLSSLAFS
jgi:hypothetical protein